MQSQKQLTLADIFRLDDFLMSDAVGENSLDIEGLHGFFTSLAVTNLESVPLAFFGAALDGEPAFASDREAWEIKDLLDRMYSRVVEDLANEEFLFEPFVLERPTPEEADSIYVPESWCEGFMHGVAIQRDMWEAGGEDLWEFLLPIYVYSGMEELPGEVEKDLFDSLNREDLIELIDFCVRQMHKYWTGAGRGSFTTH